ncbi:hypothetical protein JTB14_031329 [Gonioctena quinquepunctata]|nr:hypothetical protein JTB14_031329 [Gonioctena quinquepunctata]
MIAFDDHIEFLLRSCSSGKPIFSNCWGQELSHRRHDREPNQRSPGKTAEILERYIANSPEVNTDADTAVARQIIQLATDESLQHITVAHIGNTDDRDRQRLMKVIVEKSDVVTE